MLYTPDALVPILRDRLYKFTHSPEFQPIRGEHRMMEAVGEVMDHLIRGHLHKELLSLPHHQAALLLPEKSAAPGSLLYLHGGGYCEGDLEYAGWFGKLIASDVKVRTLCPAYRLAPEDPFPAALEDALAAYRFLLERYPEEKICLIGESAGGGLCYALCLKLKEVGLPLPAGIVTVSPWTDLTQSGASYEFNREKDPSMTREKLDTFAAAYTDDPTNPLCSPLFGDLRGMPPGQIYAGGDEIMLEDARRMHYALEKAGAASVLTVAPGFWHAYVFYFFRSRKEDQAAIRSFIRRQLL